VYLLKNQSTAGFVLLAVIVGYYVFKTLSGKTVPRKINKLSDRYDKKKAPNGAFSQG
jgi:hypothetical protein